MISRGSKKNVKTDYNLFNRGIKRNRPNQNLDIMMAEINENNDVPQVENVDNHVDKL